MVLSHCRKEAVVWSRSTDQLAWHHVHNEAYRRLAGVAAVNRIDNLKTGIAHGCGAWGVINEQYRVYARTLGFHIDACEVRSPEQKGKTERRVGALEAAGSSPLIISTVSRICKPGPITGSIRTRTGGFARRPATPWPRPGRRSGPGCDRCRHSCPSRSTWSRRCRCTRTARFISKDAPISFPLFYVGREVEVRGCSTCVQVLDPKTATVLVSYPRHTPERILIDPLLLRWPRHRAGGPAQTAGEDGAEARGDRRHASADGGRWTFMPRWRRWPDETRRTDRTPTADALPVKPPSADLTTLLAQLSKLGLDFAADALPGLLTHAVKEDLGPPALISRLLQDELDRREERRVRTSLKLSGLPTGQTLANFDFAFQPAVQRSKLEALATCAWLREKQGLLILGPPGVGKTHLAVSLGVKAVECGFSVAFFRSGGTAARDAQGRRGAADSAQGQEVHEGGAGDHRRGGLRDLHARGGEPVLPAGELPVPAGLVVHHVEQADPGVARDAGW